jgi:hypothetical protein
VPSPASIISAASSFTLLAAALGTLSKPMLITIPFVLLLIDYWPLNRFQKEKIISLILEKIPFALFAAASAVATVLAQHGQIDTFGFSQTQSLATRSICVS